jgi:hypothetical protein
MSDPVDGKSAAPPGLSQNLGNTAPDVRLYVTFAGLLLVAIGLSALLALPAARLEPDRSPATFELDEPPARGPSSAPNR